MGRRNQTQKLRNTLQKWRPKLGPPIWKGQYEWILIRLIKNIALNKNFIAWFTCSVDVAYSLLVFAWQNSNCKKFQVWFWHPLTAEISHPKRWQYRRNAISFDEPRKKKWVTLLCDMIFRTNNLILYYMEWIC